MRKVYIFLMLVGLLVALPSFAQDASMTTDQSGVTVITADDIGATNSATINGAIAESVSEIHERGILIEIGNTTADQTTLVVRVTKDGVTTDRTVEIDKATTKILHYNEKSGDLNFWIAGDVVDYAGTVNENSGSIMATKIANLSMKEHHRGHNGWVKAIRESEQEIDAEWAGTVYTLNTAQARMVAGTKNPATIADFKVGDRIRARLTADGDSNNKTWNAETVVVLRRGKDLFMRVTRWVVFGKIAYIPEDTTLPAVMTIEVLPSKFYEEGDVNNLVGVPGEPVDVLVSEKTNLRRRYMGKALLGEFNQGDRVQVIGRRNEQTGQLDAEFVRNADIQKLGVAHTISIVKSVDATAGTIVSAPIRDKGKADIDWTVITDSGTQFFKHDEIITIQDIQADDKIRVRGVADRNTKTVDAEVVSVLVSREKIKERLKEEKDLKLEEFKMFKDELLKETEEIRARKKEDVERLRKEREDLHEKIKVELQELRADFKEWKTEKRESFKDFNKEKREERKESRMDRKTNR
ncbi:MAG: hypothetical protein HY564_00005 [Candidatus Jacksonbacteria bacterium]|nr:hypothetical protein [Candidatus Jacksonbacteria bacterium]